MGDRLIISLYSSHNGKQGTIMIVAVILCLFATANVKEGWVRTFSFLCCLEQNDIFE